MMMSLSYRFLTSFGMTFTSIVNGREEARVKPAPLPSSEFIIALSSRTKRGISVGNTTSKRSYFAENLFNALYYCYFKIITNIASHFPLNLLNKPDNYRVYSIDFRHAFFFLPTFINITPTT